MFIIVKYGNNESLLCNPSCAVINLLNSIKRRAGYGNTNVCLDLSDESDTQVRVSPRRRFVHAIHRHNLTFRSTSQNSGHSSATKELDTHRLDYATKYLNSHATYVLVEKQLIPNGDDVTDGSSPSPPQYHYVPLLDNYTEIFPNYRPHVTTVERKKKAKHVGKSPSPAGIRGIKAKSKNSLRTPSRRR
ncbi:hypothetical protein LSH36_118g05015 [Paralvinella palmiformis]|uniref:Uncharacterized protein n=1 Tax=Paralvinella palmiformis TaxID=53620 RepID=A0AAD9JYC8_9ANNE|nr:hypothetical protein LSH36_118g05015 [Paralvinella palmiformis]